LIYCLPRTTKQLKKHKPLSEKLKHIFVEDHKKTLQRNKKKEHMNNVFSVNAANTKVKSWFHSGHKFFFLYYVEGFLFINQNQKLSCQKLWSFYKLCRICHHYKQQHLTRGMQGPLAFGSAQIREHNLSFWPSHLN